MEKKIGNRKYRYLLFFLLFLLFLIVVPKPYLTYPGFIVYGFEEFEKNKKECFGYSVEVRRELQPADDPEYSLCFGILVRQKSTSSTTTPEITLMQKDEKLCFKDKDCEIACAPSEGMADANSYASNLYFQGTQGCTEIASYPKPHSSICVNNKCTLKNLE